MWMQVITDVVSTAKSMLDIYDMNEVKTPLENVIYWSVKSMTDMMERMQIILWLT